MDVILHVSHKFIAFSIDFRVCLNEGLIDYFLYFVPGPYSIYK